LSGTLAAGGIIPPRPGGVPAFEPEGTEYLIPLSKTYTFELNQ